MSRWGRPMDSRMLPATIAHLPRQYRRFGLDEETIEQWEDGLRTDGSRGTYEWWYFDTHLDDGSKLVITFYTKPVTDVGKPLTPYITLNFDYPEGRSVQETRFWEKHEFSASKDRCDVRIGASTFRGDLHTYTIHVEINDVVADVTLIGQVPPWRPKTGHALFGKEEEHFFAWLPSVPQGTVEATIRVGAEKRHARGIGYHDHNWGNIAVQKLIHHWYWARGKIGDYTLIASHIIAERAYGYTPLTVFMLARDGMVIADEGDNAAFRTADRYIDDFTGKPVANDIAYDYRDNDQRYTLTFRREKDLTRMRLVDEIHGITHLLAKMVRFDGAYLRFSGALRLDRYDGERVTESQRDEAIWELMYFGKVREQPHRESGGEVPTPW
jgi:predicted secreted hydrolase